MLRQGGTRENALAGAADERGSSLTGAAEDHGSSLTGAAEERASWPRPFGPYELVRKLATGRTADVFAAKEKGAAGAEGLVALKVLHAQLCDEAYFVEGFAIEAELSMRLAHPNVARALGFGSAEGRRFLAMEYVEGLDAWALARGLAAAGARLPLEACVYVALETLAALEYVHSARGRDGQPLGVVHRDVAPQNILIGTAGQVKLADFGAATTTLRPNEAAAVEGRYEYMSPEQAWGDPVDRRSDVFSAAAVLHELSSGRTTRRAEGAAALLDEARWAPIPRLSVFRAGIPPAIDAAVLRGLARRPEDRFESAAAFAAALARALSPLTPSDGAAALARLVRESRARQ